MKQFQISLCCVSFAVAAHATVAAAATYVTLRERIVATSPVVRLGNIAEITTADRVRARQLAAISLMPAPAPGTERFVGQREVEDLLTAHGVDLRELRFKGASQVAIFAPAGNSAQRATETSAGTDDGEPMNRHAAILAGYSEPAHPSPVDETAANGLRDKVGRAIAAYLNSQTGRDYTGCVSCELAERNLALLQGATSPLECRGGREPWAGRQRFVVSFSTPQGPAQVTVYANVAAASGHVVVAVEPIARGEVITAANVELQPVESMPLASSRRAPVDSLEKIVGMEARQAIQAGDVLFTDHVRAPLIVKRGEVITVVSQGGGIRVRTTARARQDGAKGDLVQVESLQTRETYDVRVTGPREAAVFAAFVEPTEKSRERIETARK